MAKDKADDSDTKPVVEIGDGRVTERTKERREGGKGSLYREEEEEEEEEEEKKGRGGGKMVGFGGVF